MRALTATVASGLRRRNAPAIVIGRKMTFSYSRVRSHVWAKIQRRQRSGHYSRKHHAHQRLGESLHELRASDLQTQFFGKPFANFRGQAVMDMAGSNSGDIDYRHGRGRSDRDDQPDQR